MISLRELDAQIRNAESSKDILKLVCELSDALDNNNLLNDDKRWLDWHDWDSWAVVFSDVAEKIYRIENAHGTKCYEKDIYFTVNGIINTHCNSTI